MALHKRDWLFVAIVAAVFGTFFLLSGEIKTARVPFDDTHKEIYPVARADGKKAGEKFCGACHTKEKATLPDNKDHRPQARCLFCHKLEER